MGKTRQIAREAKALIQTEEWQVDEEDTNYQIRRLYLGRTWVLSGNEPWSVEFADRLEAALGELGLSMEGGEGDTSDQYAVEVRITPLVKEEHTNG